MARKYSAFTSTCKMHLPFG